MISCLAHSHFHVAINNFLGWIQTVKKNRAREWTLRNYDPTKGQRPYLFKRYSISQLKRKLARNAFCVVVGEEGVYRIWLWFPECSPKEMEDRWRNAPSWGYDWIKYLGGRWMSEREYAGEAYAKGTQATKFVNLVDKLRENYQEHYYAYVCCDQDSELRTPDGRYIVHSGFTGERRTP